MLLQLIQQLNPNNNIINNIVDNNNNIFNFNINIDNLININIILIFAIFTLKFFWAEPSNVAHPKDKDLKYDL